MTKTFKCRKTGAEMESISKFESIESDEMIARDILCRANVLGLIVIRFRSVTRVSALLSLQRTLIEAAAWPGRSGLPSPSRHLRLRCPVWLKRRPRLMSGRWIEMAPRGKVRKVWLWRRWRGGRKRLGRWELGAWSWQIRLRLLKKMRK